MPSVNDIATIAEALEKHPVAAIQDRCVCVRNRNATCRRCVEACPVGALRVSGNQVSLDSAACSGCGACVSACPTEALIALAPTDAKLEQAIATSPESADGEAVIACARIAAKRIADPAAFAEVPCLARVHERDVLGAIAAGARGVLLVDGECSTCRYGSVSARIDDVVTTSNYLLEGRGVSGRAHRATSFPQRMMLQSTEGVFGSTRRAFFSEAAAAARETTMTAARVTLAEQMPASAAPQIGERLRVGEGGAMPQLEVPRHDALLNALDAIGSPVASQVTSRLFGSVSIDGGTCNACGMCATFCPTGALARGEDGGRVSDVRTLEFSACDCVQCGLCVDVCWKGSLSLSDVVDACELFDFEPVVFDLSNVTREKSLFGRTTVAPARPAPGQPAPRPCR